MLNKLYRAGEFKLQLYFIFKEFIMGKGKSGRNNSNNDFKSIFKQNKGGGKQNTVNLNNPRSNKQQFGIRKSGR